MHSAKEKENGLYKKGTNMYIHVMHSGPQYQNVDIGIIYLNKKKPLLYYYIYLSKYLSMSNYLCLSIFTYRVVQKKVIVISI